MLNPYTVQKTFNMGGSSLNPLSSNQEEKPFMTNDDYINRFRANNPWLFDMETSYAEKPETRGFFNRFTDLLSVGQYATMGALRGIIDEDRGVLEGIGEGLRASNPFGKGYEEGEHSFHDVMTDTGWNPSTGGGRVAKAVIGLAGDIFLDPLTYVGGGFGKVLKGTGEVASKSKRVTDVFETLVKTTGAVGAKSVDDIATHILNEAVKNGTSMEDALKISGALKTEYTQALKAFEKGMSVEDAMVIVNKNKRLLGEGDDVLKEATRLSEKFNKLIGYGVETEGLTLSLKHAPFGSKIFGKHADKTIELVSADKLYGLSKALGTGEIYANLRHTIVASQIGKMFGSSHIMYKSAMENPEGMYSLMKFIDMKNGVSADKAMDIKSIRKKAQEFGFKNLTPDEVNKIIKIAEDPNSWNVIRETLAKSDTQSAKDVVAHFNKQKNAYAKQINELELMKTKLTEMKNNKSFELDELTKGIMLDSEKAEFKATTIKRVEEEIVSQIMEVKMEDLPTTELKREYMIIVEDLIDQTSNTKMDEVLDSIDVSKVDEYVDGGKTASDMTPNEIRGKVSDLRRDSAYPDDESRYEAVKKLIDELGEKMDVDAPEIKKLKELERHLTVDKEAKAVLSDAYEALASVTPNDVEAFISDVNKAMDKYKGASNNVLLQFRELKKKASLTELEKLTEIESYKAELAKKQSVKDFKLKDATEEYVDVVTGEYRSVADVIDRDVVGGTLSDTLIKKVKADFKKQGYRQYKTRKSAEQVANALDMPIREHKMFEGTKDEKILYDVVYKPAVVLKSIDNAKIRSYDELKKAIDDYCELKKGFSIIGNTKASIAKSVTSEAINELSKVLFDYPNAIHTNLAPFHVRDLFDTYANSVSITEVHDFLQKNYQNYNGKFNEVASYVAGKVGYGSNVVGSDGTKIKSKLSGKTSLNTLGNELKELHELKRKIMRNNTSSTFVGFSADLDNLYEGAPIKTYSRLREILQSNKDFKEVVGMNPILETIPKDIIDKMDITAILQDIEFKSRQANILTTYLMSLDVTEIAKQRRVMDTEDFFKNIDALNAEDISSASSGIEELSSDAVARAIAKEQIEQSNFRAGKEVKQSKPAPKDKKVYTKPDQIEREKLVTVLKNVSPKLNEEALKIKEKHIKAVQVARAKLFDKMKKNPITRDIVESSKGDYATAMSKLHATDNNIANLLSDLMKGDKLDPKTQQRVPYLKKEKELLVQAMKPLEARYVELLSKMDNPADKKLLDARFEKESNKLKERIYTQSTATIEGRINGKHGEYTYAELKEASANVKAIKAQFDDLSRRVKAEPASYDFEALYGAKMAKDINSLIDNEVTELLNSPQYSKFNNADIKNYYTADGNVYFKRIGDYGFDELVKIMDDAVALRKSRVKGEATDIAQFFADNPKEYKANMNKVYEEVKNFSQSDLIKFREEEVAKQALKDSIIAGNAIKAKDDVVQIGTVNRVLKRSIDELADLNFSLKHFEVPKQHIVTKKVEKITEQFSANVAELEFRKARMRTTQRDLLESNKKLKDIESQIDQLYNDMKATDAFINNDRAIVDFLETKVEGFQQMYEQQNQLFGEANWKYMFEVAEELSDEAKDVLFKLKKEFNQMGKEEVAIGKLNVGQYEAMRNRYLPHILSDTGKKLLEEFGYADKVVKTIPGFYEEFGFGRKFNTFGKTRQINEIFTKDGIRIENPNITQMNKIMNEQFPEILKGENMFITDLETLYTMRAIKHTELMYDNAYMHSMMTKFGKPLEMSLRRGDYERKPNAKVVMNYGEFKNFSMTATKGLRNGLIEAWVSLNMDIINEKNINSLQDFRKELPDIYKQLSEQALEDLMQEYGMTGKILTDMATPFVELTDEQISMISRSNPKPTHWNPATRKMEEVHPASMIYEMKNSIVDTTNQLRLSRIAKDNNDMLSMYDKFLHFIKINQTTVMPGFHARNKVSNMFNSYLAVGNDVFDFDLQKATFKAVKANGAFEGGVKLADGKGFIEWQELYDNAQRYKVIGEGFFESEIGVGAESKGLFKNFKRGTDPTDVKNFKPYLWGAKAGTMVENHDRFLMFTSLVRNGKSYEESAQIVAKHLFDYSDLTSFEQNVMKRIFPYYTWLRKNSPLQLEMMLEKPEIYRNINKVFNSVENMVSYDNKLEAGDIPEYAQDWVQTPFTITNSRGFKETILWNPNLPFQDLEKLLSIKAWASSASPILKAPVEQITNHNIFTGKPLIKRGEGGELASRANHLLSNFAFYNAGKGIANADNSGDAGLQALSRIAGVKASGFKGSTDSAKESISKKREDLNERWK